MNLYMKYIIPILSASFLSILSFLGFYIYGLKREIAFLNDKVKTAEYDLMKTKSDLLMQNQKLLEESSRITKYNNISPMYKNVIDSKYSNDKSSGNCEDNMNVINNIFKKQGVYNAR